jgi:conjugal transfer pilus assembly protein TrbC
VIMASTLLAIGVYAQSSQSSANRPLPVSKDQRVELLDKAERQMQPGRKLDIQPATPPTISTKDTIIDPEKIARQFNQINTKPKEEDTNEVMIFVSTSMPKGSLQRIARDAKTTNSLIAIRGASQGVGPGLWVKSVADLKPMTDLGVEVQYHPDLFDRYAIKRVPAVVVAPEPVAGCTEDACRPYAVLYGDVTLDYALERLANRKDGIGTVARERLKKMRVQ